LAMAMVMMISVIGAGGRVSLRHIENFYCAPGEQYYRFRTRAIFQALLHKDRIVVSCPYVCMDWVHFSMEGCRELSVSVPFN